jgi:membrane protein
MPASNQTSLSVIQRLPLPLQRLARFVLDLGRAIDEHQLSLRAAGLTYTTVLSLVPFLAIAFAVLKGFGVQNALEPVLLKVVGESSREVVTRIIGYVNNTNVKSLGLIGLLTLLVTVINLLTSIEEAFNAICGVSETRSLQRRFSDYLSVVVVGPVLLMVAMSMTSSLQSQWLVQWLINHTVLGDAILLLFRLVP